MKSMKRSDMFFKEERTSSLELEEGPGAKAVEAIVPPDVEGALKGTSGTVTA